MSGETVDLAKEMREGILVSDLLSALKQRQSLDWGALGQLVFMASLPREGSAWSFRTGSLEVISTGEGPGQMVIDLTDTVFPVREKPEGAFRQTLLIGRASSNDIQIRHGSVSKLHARIELNADPPTLADADSRNGTMHNEKRLEPNVAVGMNPGDFLDFGDISVRVVSVANLEMALSRMSQGG